MLWLCSLNVFGLKSISYMNKRFKILTLQIVFNHERQKAFTTPPQ